MSNERFISPHMKAGSSEIFTSKLKFHNLSCVYFRENRSHFTLYDIDEQFH